MSDTKKIKKAALILFGVVGVVFLFFLFQIARGVIHNSTYVSWNAFSVTSYVVGTLIVFASLVIGLSLLNSIRKDETPFNYRNVNKLKAIAILLVIHEPYYFIAQRSIQKFLPIVLSDGSSILVKSSLGGFVFVSGLVVYCIALVFEYGISLQNQVDETL